VASVDDSGTSRRGEAVAPKARLAVFDYDGTIISAQSGTQFTKYLLLNGYISPLSALKVILWGARYTLHLPHDQAAVRGYLVNDLDRLTRAQILEIMGRFHDDVLTRFYRPAALEQVRACREDGCVCVLVSATFHGIAQAAARHIGMDAFLATRMAVNGEGHMTGAVDGEVVEGAGKCRAVTRWADGRFGPDNWVVEYAFGDHHSDEEMLSLARHPYAVDPGRSLRSVAKRRGWPVLLWE